MHKPDEDGRYPLSTKEYEALRGIFGALNALNTYALNDRLELIEGGADDLTTAKGLMQDVCDQLLGTVPLNKLQAIRRELKHTICELRLRGPVPTKEGGYVYIDQKALARLADRAIQMNCVLCEKDMKEGRRCPLFKDLNACFPYELNSPDDVLCPFSGVGTVLLED